jgi:hypothetical protein
LPIVDFVKQNNLEVQLTSKQGKDQPNKDQGNRCQVNKRFLNKKRTGCTAFEPSFYSSTILKQKTGQNKKKSKNIV